MAAVQLSELTQSLSYLKPSDVARVEEAYRFSDTAHHGQKRMSGEPYISHPLAVAENVSTAALHVCLAPRQIGKCFENGEASL